MSERSAGLPRLRSMGGTFCPPWLVGSMRAEERIALTKRSRKRVRPRLLEGLHVDAFGDRIDLSRRPGVGEVPTEARPLCEVGYAEFGDLCPLCTGRLAPSEAGRRGSSGTVPPHRLHGVVHTRTCVKCNAGGALAEAELLRWWSQAYPTRFATRGLPGSRTGGDVLLRTATNGKFALVVSGGAAAGVHDVLTTAGLTDD